MPRNSRAPLFRPPGALAPAERLAAWRARYEREHPRPPAPLRGYDKSWRELRAEVLAEEPYCRDCARRGIERRATMVDHIVSIREAPELRLERSNLQALCFPCHQRKTNQSENGFGLGGDLKNFALTPRPDRVVGFL
jgi:5-methylcytosine-specific restriction protein A